MSEIASLSIVFENEHFIAVDKPGGWLSIPSRLGSQDTRPCVQTYLTAEKKQNVFPVHRLDYEVSGLLLFAKDAEAHRMANDWFEKREVKKHYEAITEIPLETDLARHESYRWFSRLVRGKKRAYERPFGKEAVTLAEWFKSSQAGKVPLAHWKLDPQTGRPHQLRYELSKRGFPIWGDALYGAQHTPPGGHIALRSMGLDFSQCPDRDKVGMPEKLAVSPREDYGSSAGA